MFVHYEANVKLCIRFYALSTSILVSIFLYIFYFCYNRYQVCDLLGQGTFGQVVRCICIETRKFYAVKIIKSQPAYYNQAKSEIRILERVQRIPGSENLIV